MKKTATYRSLVRRAVAAVVASLLVVGGSALAAPAAFADELAPTATSAPAPDSAVPDEPAQDVAEQPAPEETPVAEAPPEETPVAEAPVQATEAPIEAAEPEAPAAVEAAPAPTVQALVADAAPVAELTVSKTSGLDPAGEEITVSGTGYEINTGGIYAQIGWLKEGEWTPVSADDTRAANRTNAYAALVGSGFPGQPEWTVAPDGSGSFTWTVTVTKAALDAKKKDGYVLAAFTLGSHSNWIQPANERFVALSFAEPAPVAELSVSKTSGLDPAGEEITVSGTGYEINTGGIYAQIGWLKAGEWTPVSADDTRAANRTNAYAALVGSGFPGQPEWTVAPDGSGSFTWTVTVTKAALDAKKKDGYTLAAFTLGSHSNWVQPANERFVPLSFADAAPVAELTVSKTSGLDPAGEEITVSGTGYEINTGGIYAQIGWLKADAWTPLSADDTRAENRTNAYAALVGSGFPGQPEWTVAPDGSGSFSWTVTVTKAALDAKKKDGYTLAAFTLGSHSNWIQPANERFVALSFAEPAPVAELTVSKTSGLNPAGEEITVSGTGYEINTGGIYAQIGWLKADAWTPLSADDTRAENRTNAYAALIGSGFPGQPLWVVAPDGSGSFSWTVTVTKAALDAKKKDGFVLAAFTLGSHMNWIQPANERFVPLSFAEPAPTAELSVSKTSGLNPAGEEITVSGTGYEINTGGIYAQIGWLKADAWTPLSADDTRAENRTNAYAALIGSGFPGQPLWVVAPDGSGSFSWTVTVTKAALDAKKKDGYTLAAFTLGSHSNWVQPANERFVPLSFADAAPVAELTVSKTSGLDPAGEEITVSGTGYEINTGGIYAQIGWLKADEWTPLSADDTRAENRTNAYAALIGSGFPGQPEWTVAEDGSGSFSWTVTVTKAALDAKKKDGFVLAAFTLGSHSNWIQPANERFVPLSFAEPAATPRITVSPATGVNPAAATTFTVTGSNFTGPGAANGVYVNVGAKSAWQPGQVPDASGFLATTWVMPNQVVGGSFTTTVTVPAGTFDKNLSYGVSTFAAHGLSITNRSLDTYTPISFRDVTQPTDPPTTPPTTPPTAPPVPPTDPVVNPVPVPSGSLSWGVKDSFRSYIPTIAKGTITVGNGATSSGDSYQFGQIEGGDYNAATGTGTARYTGSVRFYGHAGALDLTFSSPQVRVSSASSADLLFTVNGSQVTLASIDLSSASRSGSDGAVRYSGAPVTLTAAGSTAFAGFYPAGQSLDPISFTIGSPGAAPSGTTGTVTSAAVVTTVTPPATPPASTGIELDAATMQTLVTGGEVTISVDGFQPNEEGIMVVVYSTPTVLARDLVADANGVVTWTGKLPFDLSGQHTLTFQGSISKGVVLDIPVKVLKNASACAVTGGTLTWGFKESFRSYISGSIANGEWTVTDGASYETPDFSWANGTGGIDPATDAGNVAFTGAITFTGHGGVLNTTVANPRIELVDESIGYIVLDVTGTTQEGAPVSATGVRFVELDLASGEPGGEGEGATSLSNVPATLTAEGAAAFGTYPEGEAFDPVSYTIETADCATTVVDDDPEAQDAASSTTTASPELASSTDLSWLIWLIVAFVVVVAAIVALLVVRNRRKGAAE
ncbi:HtaA domain-containing protein [Compostimonas suwonensis]|uniref:Htaa protein n=1 Tax=Compostimonas suwonensis TaxID=1048394 RepID=A0A2M9BVJ0_9MICO|nr:HtaA domain-containing protein [Compostimonas suwonensis]PJJ61966.1 Htaa protein [Compostimonas suwonensis]